MGISIQAYRCRIGTFVPKFLQIPTKNNYKYFPTINENQTTEYTTKRKFLLYIVLLLFFLFPLVNFFLVQSNIQSYNHPIYPDFFTYSSQLDTFSNTSLSGRITSDIAFNFILSFGINSLAASTFTMITNFQSKCKHGNRRAGGIKISHWNKGPGFLQNKIPEIKNIVNGLNPHILGISEANLHQNHDHNLVELEDYLMHTCPTIDNLSLKTSRVVVYTHKSLVVKPRPDLMSDKYASIWMEVGLPHHKKFLICQTYRESQLPNQPD